MNTTVWARSALVVPIIAVLLALVPMDASAATQASVAGILPPGTTACPVVGVSEITPFVYNGSLDSFDVSVTDTSYVAVAADIAGEKVDFHYLTRRINPDGTLRVHVDIASTPVSQDLPITITLLSSRGDTHVTCALTVSGMVSRGTTAPPVQPATPGQPPVSLPPAPTHTPSSYLPYPNSNGHTGQNGGKGTVAGSLGSTTSTSTIKLPPQTPNTVFVGALHSLGTVCSKNSSWKLWAILLVLYFLFVLALALQSNETLTDGSRGWNTVLIVALLAALLGLWYLSAACRAGPWAPIVAIIIALAGVRALMRKTVSPPTLLIEK